MSINVNNVYWLFLHVKFREKGIRLYDSLEVNPENRTYLVLMRKYLYNVELKGIPAKSRPDFEE